MLGIRLAATAALIAIGLAGLAGPTAPAGAEEQIKTDSPQKSEEQKKAEQKKAAIETTKVEGTDNVYTFRNGNSQAMFIVTKDGVIATDPVSYNRPTGAQDYINEIRKITQAPIRYLVYSHHHLDHIAGGKVFKDAGATVIAHRNAKWRLQAVKHPNTPIPDRTVDRYGEIWLGGTKLELHYLGLGHSDSTLVMRLPREKIIFVVDSIPVGTIPGRGMIDFYPLDAERFMQRVLALDWERLIPGHPGVPKGRLGTRQDAENILKFYQVASAEGRRHGEAGRCWEPAEKEFKVEGFENYPNYADAIPFVARRYCGLWGRGT
jgi:glyoxylase-like metal-dependent hydrolase (beta-lactamase superfamily II)